MGQSASLSARIRLAFRANDISTSTEKRYRSYIHDYIQFHGKRHPGKLREPEVAEYLAQLNNVNASGPTVLSQALSAIQFLYREVLKIDLDWLDDAIRSSSSQQFPVVLTRPETNEVLDRLDGVYHLIGCLLYGSGLRVVECISLRVKDFDFDNKLIVVRDDEEQIQRVTILPVELIPKLKKYLKKVKLLFDADAAYTPAEKKIKVTGSRFYALKRNDWRTQYVFPKWGPAHDIASDNHYRGHIDGKSLQKVVKLALKQAGIEKSASCHTFRHCFAARLLSQGQDVKTVQELLGQRRPRSFDLNDTLTPPKYSELISPLSQLYRRDSQIRVTQ